MIKFKGKSGYSLQGKRGERRWRKTQKDIPELKQDGKPVLQMQMLAPLALSLKDLAGSDWRPNPGIRSSNKTFIDAATGKEYYAKRSGGVVAEMSGSLLGKMIGARTGTSLYIPYSSREMPYDVASEKVEGAVNIRKHSMHELEKINPGMMQQVYYGSLLQNSGQARGIILGESGIRGKDYDIDSAAHELGKILFLNTLMNNDDTTIQSPRAIKPDFAGGDLASASIYPANGGPAGNLGNVLLDKNGVPIAIDLEMSRNPVFSFGGGINARMTSNYSRSQMKKYAAADAQLAKYRLRLAYQDIDRYLPKEMRGKVKRGFLEGLKNFSNVNLDEGVRKLKEEAFIDGEHHDKIKYNPLLQENVAYLGMEDVSPGLNDPLSESFFKVVGGEPQKNEYTLKSRGRRKQKRYPEFGPQLISNHMLFGLYPDQQKQYNDEMEFVDYDDKSWMEKAKAIGSKYEKMAEDNKQELRTAKSLKPFKSRLRGE